MVIQHFTAVSARGRSQSGAAERFDEALSAPGLRLVTNRQWSLIMYFEHIMNQSEIRVRAASIRFLEFLSNNSNFHINDVSFCSWNRFKTGCEWCLSFSLNDPHLTGARIQNDFYISYDSVIRNYKGPNQAQQIKKGSRDICLNYRLFN